MEEMIYASLMDTAVTVSEPKQRSWNETTERKRQRGSLAAANEEEGASNQPPPNKKRRRKSTANSTQETNDAKKVSLAKLKAQQHEELEFRLEGLFHPEQPSDTKLVQLWHIDEDKKKKRRKNNPSKEAKQHNITRTHWQRRTIDARDVLQDYGGAVQKRLKLMHKLGCWPKSPKEEENASDVNKTKHNRRSKSDKEDNSPADSSDDDDSHSQDSGSSDSDNSVSSLPETLKMESEDGDLMQQLVGDENESAKAANESDTDADYWEKGLIGPKFKFNLPLVQIVAKDIQPRKSKNDDDRLLQISDRTAGLIARTLKASAQGKGILYPFRHNPRARMYETHHQRMFGTSPQVFLRNIARRYLGNNAASSKEEQVGHIACLWKLLVNQVAPGYAFRDFGRRGRVEQRKWQLHRWWHLINTRLTAQYLWFIQNDCRLPGEGNQRKRLDFNERRIFKSNVLPPPKFKAQYPPHQAYVFLPLTSPPAPQLPLDRTEITWGGICRYEHSFQRYNEVPWFNYKLTTSILLADRNQIKLKRNIEWYRGILKKELKTISNNHLWEQLAMGEALMVHHVLAIWTDSNDNDKRREWLETILQEKSLAAMSDLHLTRSLMAIVAMFNNREAVLGILSRDPLELNPITMFQVIVNDHLPKDATLLEHVIHEHTTRTPVEHNATDPIYYSWYMAFLATSFILCEETSSFLSIRIQLAQALKLLYELHTLVPTEQTTAALKSLERWKEVWCLLLLGEKEATVTLRPVLKTKTDKFDKVAHMLETSPASIRSWREVVNVLGPVSQAKSWNLEDREWWYDLFLKPIEQIPFGASWLSPELTLLDNGDRQLVTEAFLDRDAFSHQADDIEWLDLLITDLKDCGEATDSYHDLKNEGTSESELNQIPLLVDMNDQLEYLSYKVLLVAHFLSMDHPDVGWSLLCLVDKTWEKAGCGLSAEGMKCAHWLRRMGIDVNKVFVDAISRCHQESLKQTYNNANQNQKSGLL